MRHFVVLSGLILSAAIHSVSVGMEAPVVFWASDPVRPGEVVVVQGGRWGKQPKVELTWLGGGKPAEPAANAAAQARNTVTLTPLGSSADALKFLVPASWKPGVYRVEVNADGVKSAARMLNAPDPWWQQGDWGKQASPGGWLRIFGKCLSFDEQASVALRGGIRDLILKPGQQDCWSLGVELPKDLPAGEYQVLLRNGYEGQAGWREAGKIRIAPHAPVWKTDLFDVTKFGAVPNDGMDDTDAVQKALDAAGGNGGGVVYLPRGRFQMNGPIRIPRFVLLKGAGMKLSQIYWRDTAEPVEALIYATNSFGIEDLTIMAANHRYGILADCGDKPGAGNVTLRRLHVHLNRFEQLQAEQAARRFLPMPWEHAICLGGENVQMTDCEVFSSRSPFGFAGLHNSVLRNNRCFEGDASHMFDGDGIIFEDNQIDGGPVGRGGGNYANRLYYARNKVGMTPLADGEGFSTDGGGYVAVKLASADGVHLTLAGDVDWQRMARPNQEVCICIIEGTGAGQYRKVASYRGRQAELERPWTLPPDATSVLHVIPHRFLQNLIVANQFHDVTMLQSYAWAFEWVLAGNRFTRAGGIRIFTHPGDPAWYMQCLDNEIDVGNGYRGPAESQPPLDSALAVQSGQARCQVFRRNLLHNNARIELNWDPRDVVIEHNSITDADVGIDAGRSPGALLWGNRFERVKEPLRNISETVFMQPADRMLNELSAVEGSLPPGSQALVARLKELAVKDPLSPGLTEEIRACVLQWLRQASAAPQQDYPPEFLKALLGVRLSPAFPETFRPLLDSVGGKGQLWLPLEPPACSVPVRLSLAFPPTPACQVGDLKQLALTPGTVKGVSLDVAIQPGVVGQCHVPVRWTAEGEGWKLSGRSRLKVGDEWCGRITQWAICGPFPNAMKNALDEAAIHGPERRLDLAAQYDTPAGKRGWQTVQASKLDFTEQYGRQRSAVAYAVAVLRAKRPVPVLLDFNVPGHYILEPSLNGQPWRVPNHYGRCFSRTLKQGDNILMAKLANLDKAWTLEARVRMVDWAEPGDVAIVPVENLSSVTLLHPPPKPPIPQGKSLPFSKDVDWKLAYEDDFDRARLGSDWSFVPTSWAEGPFNFGHGMITARSEMYSFLSYAHKVTLPLRVEYDVRATASCVSAATLTKANEVGLCGADRPMGYAMTCGNGGHVLSREGEKVAASKGNPGIEQGKWYHVVVQFVPPKAMLLVDGKPAIEYEDKQWLSGLDTFSFMGDAWSAPQIDNVRIYTAGSKPSK
jgi:hypothetical protein